MQKKIIGIVGFIGSGKGTVGLHLTTQHNFRAVSFASSLKDAVSAIFNWPRDLLEGDTQESRQWREEPDEWWSKKLGRTATPRWILQNIGTDIMRDHFHNNIWIWSLENRIRSIPQSVVITDVRFENEVKMIRNLNGKIIWVKRGVDPEWLNTAMFTPGLMPELYPDVHSSEYRFLETKPDYIVHNNSSLVNLYTQIDNCININQ